MTDNKKSSPQKGEFIDLEKGQYKKNTNFKKFFLIIFFIVSSILVVLLYFNFFNFNNLSILNRINEQTELKDEQILVANPKKELSKIDNEQINLIINKLDDFSTQIINNQAKLSKNGEIIVDLTKQIQISERRNQQNSDFLLAEKYIILNALLNLKNKFEKRKEFKDELNVLNSRLYNESEIKNLISFFEDLNIKRISKVKDLLDRLNKKINYYEQDLDTIVNSKLSENVTDNFKIIESKEDFIIYLKSLFHSTFKITKVDKETNFQSQLTFEDLNFLKFLNKSKEYLIIGNINESINVLKNSSFDDIDINQWIDDASDLNNSREKLESLESMLLEIIGKDVY